MRLRNSLARVWSQRVGRAASAGVLALLASASPAYAMDEETAFLKQRVFRIPIEVAADKNDTIKELRLFVSSDHGTTWQQVAVVPPTQKSFTFRARVDGEYWFGLAYVDQSGQVEPTDIRTQAPGLKVVVDTEVPVLQLRPAERVGDKAGVEWRIMDDHPVELASLRMEVRDKREGSWQQLYPEAMLEGMVDWPATAEQGFVIRATVEDRAGNVGSAEIDIPGTAPARPAVSNTPENDPDLDIEGAPPAPSSRGTDFTVPPPPALPEAAPPATASTNRMIPRVEAPAPAPVPAAAPTPPPMDHVVAKPNYDPVPTPTPAPMAAPTAPMTPPSEMIASTAVPVRPAPTHTVKKPAPEPPAPRIPLIGSTRFAVDYTVRGVGPAGVGKVELFYTKDNGIHWALLGEDADKAPPFEVDLPGEGRYGLAIIVTSPGGNGQRPPQAGDPPRIQVEVDTTAPEAELYRPVPDPSAPAEAMLISWAARDSHLGDKPVRLYYSVQPDGPWEPISADLPSTGQYSWRVPPRTPYQVFLRLAVADLCNNESAATTPEPVMVDLSRPEGEVIGIAILPEAQTQQR